MRKIEDARRIEELFDTRIKNVNMKKERDKVTFTFDVGADNSINPNPFPIHFRVWFSKPSPRVITTSYGKMKIFASELMFDNDKTGMSSFKSHGFKDINEGIIFSTISAIVIKYFERTSKTQGIHFTAAHQGLHKAYKILSREAERKGPLKWANPSSSPTRYYIIRQSIWESYLNKVGVTE